MIRGTQLRPASVQFGLAVVGAERGGAGKDWSAVAFFSTDTRHSICGDVFNHDSTFAFDHHGLVVGTDAAALKPRIAEYLVEQGDKLTEMGRAFDGRAGETEILCHFVIVNGQMTVVFLVAQHLPWSAKLSNQHCRVCHRFAPLSIGDLVRGKLAEALFNVLIVGCCAVCWRLVATCVEMFGVQTGENDDLRAQKRHIRCGYPHDGAADLV